MKIYNLLVILITLLFCEMINGTKTIMLTKTNLATLRGVINEESSGRLINDLISIPEDDIYIYLTTGGGGVIAGYQIVEIIDTLTESGKRVHCIADLAASMGFVILQSCPVRYVRQNSMLMQHQIQVYDKGAIEQVMERMRMGMTLEKLLNDRQAKRLGITPDEFKQRILNDWYMSGEDAITNGAADELIHVRCNQELIDSRSNYTKKEFFSSVIEEYSGCPLIRTPIRTEEKLMFNIDSKKKLFELDDYVILNNN
jgi:ATP-dependent protease ClpP protease subunit